MTVTASQVAPTIGRTTYHVFHETDRKMPLSRTIEDAISRYRTLYLHDPDHILMRPAQAAEVGPRYTTVTKVPLTVDVIPHPIVPLNEVYVGSTTANGGF